MSQLLPRKPPVERPEGGPRVVEIDDRESRDVFSALSSEVARTILTELYRNPATQSELADHVDTSIQNVNYHLDQLVAADLVEVVDQWYSEKGAPMDVYAPGDESLILLAGNREKRGATAEITAGPQRKAATSNRGE